MPPNPLDTATPSSSSSRQSRSIGWRRTKASAWCRGECTGLVKMLASHLLRYCLLQTMYLCTHSSCKYFSGGEGEAHHRQQASHWFVLEVEHSEWGGHGILAFSSSVVLISESSLTRLTTAGSYYFFSPFEGVFWDKIPYKRCACSFVVQNQLTYSTAVIHSLDNSPSIGV